jgi:hypothetical protein
MLFYDALSSGVVFVATEGSVGVLTDVLAGDGTPAVFGAATALAGDIGVATARGAGACIPSCSLACPIKRVVPF